MPILLAAYDTLAIYSDTVSEADVPVPIYEPNKIPFFMEISTLPNQIQYPFHCYSRGKKYSSFCCHRTEKEFLYCFVCGAVWMIDFAMRLREKFGRKLEE